MDKHTRKTKFLITLLHQVMENYLAPLIKNMINNSKDFSKSAKNKINSVKGLQKLAVFSKLRLRRKIPSN